MPRDRGLDRRGRLARQRQEIARRPGRPARHHLEAHAGWYLHPLPHLGHLAGRHRDATCRSNSDRGAQGLHPQPLDARLGRCRRVWQVRPRHRDRDLVRRHGRLPLRRFPERRPGADECVREYLEACRRRLRPRAHGLQRLHPRRHEGVGRGPAGQQRHPDPISRRTSSSKASAPRESSASAPRTGPQVQVPREEYLGDGTPAPKTASRPRPSFPNTEASPRAKRPQVPTTSASGMPPLVTARGRWRGSRNSRRGSMPSR